RYAGVGPGEGAARRPLRAVLPLRGGRHDRWRRLGDPEEHHRAARPRPAAELLARGGPVALDLRSPVAPAHTALVTQEIQRGVAGDHSALPDLAAAARPALPRIARLVLAARRAGVPVVHCTAERRPDGRGANTNARIFQYMARAETKLLPGSPPAEVRGEAPAEPSGPGAR